MPKREIRFMGLLANTDSSILNVNFLGRGFKIEAMSEEEAIELIATLEHLDLEKDRVRIYKELCMEFQCLNLNDSKRKVYIISKSYEIEEEGLPFAHTEIGSDKEYLESLIGAMRLFKVGNICLPCAYYYYIDNDTPKPIFKIATSLRIEDEPYTLESSEIPDLEKFIQNTKLPFSESFLLLAFENFELSFEAHNRNLSFLSLMISLETLFNRGDQELIYSISRNAAVLLGQDKKDSERIFSEIKKLYSKRSKLVHKGQPNTAPQDLKKLRHYVRESIKEINKTGKNKDELLDLLNVCGFGERPWAK